MKRDKEPLAEIKCAACNGTEGRSLPTLESAKRRATVLADELRTAGDFRGSSLVRVVDEDGNKVFECRVS